ncbi:hypothetical protein HYQ44_003920 [Verticillium longisporum]|nr:hypothetical protein HYQ44_003920 [Verticillium longisporum]
MTETFSQRHFGKTSSSACDSSSSTLDPRIPPPNIFLSIPIVETFVPRAPLPPSGSTTPLHHATRVKLSRVVVRIKLGRSLFDHQNIPIIQRDT